MAENPASKLAHVRPVRPLHFPVQEPLEEHLGQSKRHLELFRILVDLLAGVSGPSRCYGADQYVYWNPRSPKRCLAPDGFIKLGVPNQLFDSWKTWELGVPELAIELVSPSDTPERWTFKQKLLRYHQLGVRELVFCNVDESPNARLRVWDLIEGDLVERTVGADTTTCLTLGDRYAWTVGPADGWPVALRLACDGELVPTSKEKDRAASARIAELEAKLGSRNAER